MGWVHHAAPEVEAQSQYREILGVCLSLTVLMVITVSLRLGLRAHARRLGAADYVMFMSMVSGILYRRTDALVETIPLTWSSSSASFTALFVSPVSISIENIRPALTSTESRYGLGLPLNLRPKQNLPIYKKVSTVYLSIDLDEQLELTIYSSTTPVDPSTKSASPASKPRSASVIYASSPKPHYPSIESSSGQFSSSPH